MKISPNHKLSLVLLFFLSISLRVFGLNWDQGQHLHPDERFLTMVVNDIKLPSSILEYFNTSSSPLNPYNSPQYQFFVYGTFPVFLTKLTAIILKLDSYDIIHLVGRVLSAIFDSLCVFCLYFLSKRIKLRNYYLAPFLYAFTVLPIQLSHFFAVDTYLSFFILLTFTLLSYRQFAFAGISFGLALACKISAIYFSPVIFVFLLSEYFKSRDIISITRTSLYLLLLSFVAFRIFQPYAFSGLFSPNPQFIANLKTLSEFNNPNIIFPPANQWLSKTKILFPLQNIILWGIGLPLSLIFLRSIRHLKLSFIVVVASIWCLYLFVYQGVQLAHTMRYFLIIYPFIILLASSLRPSNLLLVAHIIFGLMFLTIYSRPHSRVVASSWIYQNIPPLSRISFEYWDDPLPLSLQGQSPGQYSSHQLSFYDPDTPDKWQTINATINSLDYIIMSSNRLWGSIPRLPNKYPITTDFYQQLFQQKSGFAKTAEFVSYPGIRLPLTTSCFYFGPTDYPGLPVNWFDLEPNCPYPGIYLRDDIAEEAFTVYDHPKVLVFSRRDN